MSLDAATIAGFKVAELKAELEQRGLPTSGKKAELAARLTEAVANEATAVEEEAPVAAAAEETADSPLMIAALLGTLLILVLAGPLMVSITSGNLSSFASSIAGIFVDLEGESAAE